MYMDQQHATIYLSRLVRVADLPGRRSLRSSHLLLPSIRLSTVGSWAFPVAVRSIWNNLPDITLSTFCQQLKISVLSLLPYTLAQRQWFLKWFITWTTLKFFD